jgi:hypothetical protein
LELPRASFKESYPLAIATEMWQFLSIHKGMNYRTRDQKTMGGEILIFAGNFASSAVCIIVMGAENLPINFTPFTFIHITLKNRPKVEFMFLLSTAIPQQCF